jgi:hypothetical protein
MGCFPSLWPDSEGGGNIDSMPWSITLVMYGNASNIDKLLPLPQPPARARTDARTNPSAQRATQLRRVLARVYAVSAQNQITTSVP